MEELFYNFAEHIEHLISGKLGKEIKGYLREKMNNGMSPEEYSVIESDIRNIMTKYFQCATDREYFEIASNLYNAYVEKDDENLIKSVKYIIRIYSYFQNINMKKKLYQWRINAMYRKIGMNKMQGKKNSKKNIYQNPNDNMNIKKN